MLRRRIGMGWVALVLATACFSSGDPVAGSGTGGDCPPGSVGCPCYGNDSCDEGLRCATEADLCVYDEPGCTPGTLGCACDGGACTDGSVCMSGYCGMGSGQTSGMSSIESSVGTSVDSTTMIDPSTTGVETSVESGVETGVMTSGSVSDSTSETTTDASASMSASESGDPPMCAMCIDDVKLGACAAEWSDCATVTDCDVMVDDVTGCMIADNMGCVAPICSAYCTNGRLQSCILYESFADCATAACPAVCVELGCV